MHIAQVLYAKSWGDVTPETIEQGLGGRETAMIKLSEAWAKAGHRVTNFVSIDKAKRFEVGDGYHEFIPIGNTKAIAGNMPMDAFVTWELPSVFNDESIRENAKVKICEMQVAHLASAEKAAALEHCDYIAALSPWAADFLMESGFEDIPIVVLPNGVDMTRFPQEFYDVKSSSYSYKDNPKFVYSSSADRGLWPLLKAWPNILKSFPNAELKICYGMKDFLAGNRWSNGRQGQMVVEIEELVQQKGVIDCGKIGQTELAKLQQEATAWLYPLDALWPTETGCITAVENAAAGNPLIISDGDCLKSEFGDFSQVSPLPFDEDDFASKVETVLSNETMYQLMQHRGREFAETRDWNIIAQKWLDLFARDLS